MTPHRPDWQIAIAIRLQLAVSYLALLELDEQHRRVYETMYKTEDLTQWVNKQVTTQVNTINKAIEQHGEDCVVPTVAAHWQDALQERGLLGSVILAGGIKTD